MATRDRRTDAKSVSQQSERRNAATHEEKLRFISKYKAVPDPTNKRSVDRQYRALKRFPLYLQHKATAEQRKELKARGFFTTDKGVIIDGPRNVHRKRIKGARMTIQEGGVIQWSIKQRRDLIIGMTSKEKQEFAQDPQSFIERLMTRLRESHPSIPKRKKPQIRLQWGAYQATKDFSPQLFWLSSSPLGKKSRETRDYSKRRESATDRLTGIHIVYHIRKKKRAKRKRK